MSSSTIRSCSMYVRPQGLLLPNSHSSDIIRIIATIGKSNIPIAIGKRQELSIFGRKKGTRSY
eukprot:6184563-Pleurochrysis_carterae.AAC.1